MTANAEISPPMNHVFVDFENVHEVDAAVIGTKAVSFTLLLGAKQTKLDAALVEKMMEHAASVSLVRLSASSKNAVDFALAYYLGRAALADPTAYFHLVSKDKGYDPLIEHMRSRHIHVRRHDDFKTLTFSMPLKAALAPAKTIPTPAKVLPAPSADLFTRVLVHLRKNPNSRPKRKKTLASHLLALAGKTATEADITTLIEELRKSGHIGLDDKDAVTYTI